MVNIKKTRILFTTLVCAFILMNATDMFAQFSGSISFGGYRSTNVEGRDSVTPDFVFDPSLDLNYYWNISDPTLIKFEAMITPNLYQQVKSRSYTRSYFGVTGAFYLSNIEDAVPPIRVPVKDTPPVEANKTVPPTENPVRTDTIKKSIPVKLTQQDIQDIAAEKLSDLSELLDSFDIDKKGLSPKNIENLSDLKDSVSESVLALSDILSTQVYTESIADVVMSELLTQKKIFSQVPMNVSHKAEILRDLDVIIASLKVSAPQSDVLPVPKSEISNDTPMPVTRNSASADTKELVEQALVHLQTAKKEDASVMTLINSQTIFRSLSSTDISVKEDLYIKTKSTYATLLSIPISLELQSNRESFKLYSYTQFTMAPRLDVYFGENTGLGISYNFSRIVFPHDTSNVNDGTEHILRLDNRIELSSVLAFALEAGMSIHGYDHPIQYQIQIAPKKNITISTASSYSHYFFGGALILFPFERLSIGVAAHLTRSSELRPYLSDLIGANSRISGNANIDEFSYDLTRETFFSLSRIFWDIDLALDISYENRTYTNIQIPKRLQPFVQQSKIDRVDKGPQYGIQLSRQFIFDTPLIGIFDSFTPSFSIHSSNYTSTIKTFSYNDVTTSFSLVFGF